MRRLWPVLAASLLIVCTRRHPVSLSEEPYPLATATTVSAGGVTVGSLSRDHPRFDLTVTRSMPTRDGNPDLRFETDTPCGRRAIQGSLALDNHDVLTFGANVYQSLRFWYDNRGGAPAHLAIGSMGVPLPAGQTGDFRVLFAGCTGSVPVYVDGVRGGEITLDERARDRGFIVDPSGRRCYVGRTGTYSGSLASGGNPPEVFSGKRLYEWVPITDFLKEPTPSITVPSIVQVISVSAWQDVGCAK